MGGTHATREHGPEYRSRPPDHPNSATSAAVCAKKRGLSQASTHRRRLGSRLGITPLRYHPCGSVHPSTKTGARCRLRDQQLGIQVPEIANAAAVRDIRAETGSDSSSNIWRKTEEHARSPAHKEVFTVMCSALAGPRAVPHGIQTAASVPLTSCSSTE
jgi:hypothetical protein